MLYLCIFLNAWMAQALIHILDLLFFEQGSMSHNASAEGHPDRQLNRMEIVSPNSNASAVLRVDQALSGSLTLWPQDYFKQLRGRDHV